MAGIPIADRELSQILRSARGSFELSENFPIQFPDPSTDRDPPPSINHGVDATLRYIDTLSRMINERASELSRKTNGIDRKRLEKLNLARRELAKVLGMIREV